MLSDRSEYIDLSPILFRSFRSIEGGWTEILHVDTSLKGLASTWAEAEALPSNRVCPLCRGGAGTPRHVVMVCHIMQTTREKMRDLVEQ